MKRKILATVLCLAMSMGVIVGCTPKAPVEPDAATEGEVAADVYLIN